MRRTFHSILFLLGMGTKFIMAQGGVQEMLSIHPQESYQTVVGFGASLAYYESWLNAHPKKSEIYQAIFGDLSLDILRVRNAYDYDPDMVERVQEYVTASETALGYPISVFATSWGPPGYLKNTGDRKNGGTLRYTAGSGSVEFDYAGFAQWWGESLDEYNTHGIYPAYISIQNEPDWSASWETCLFKPAEVINASDTIAGYNEALDAVYDTLNMRDQTPKILGPETVGIGYNSVENYVNSLDLTKLDGIAHHLYHGVDENNPFASSEFSKVGDFHPEVPHFQSEYSRGDWFSLAGLIYKSFYDEQVVAYLYWDLIWNEGGLVQLDFPWDQSQWIDPQKGYTKTKDFFAFKQFSAFIHPGWQMTGNSLTGTNGATLTFVSPTGDSAACVVINRSDTEDLNLHVTIPGYRIHESAIYTTSSSENCQLKGSMTDSLLTISPHSITTVDMRISEYDPLDDREAPTTPTGVTVLGSTVNSLNVSWDPSEDSVGVEGYSVFVDGTFFGVTTDTSYVVAGLKANSDYLITVSAFDHVPNESGKSIPVIGTTLALPDTLAPTLEATDSIYQEGTVAAVSSEDGKIYLTVEGTGAELAAIREACIDSVVAMAGVTLDITVSGLENGLYWLYATDSAGNISEPEVITILGVGMGKPMVQQFNIFPNPFSRSTTIQFTLNENQRMKLTVIDSQGRVVSMESLGHFPAGNHTVVFRRDGLSDGLYFFKLENSRGAIRSGRLVIQD
ncbi:MAG: T9SS type A sorting domain-containing protein [Bacteroidota bacterium]